VLGPRSQPATGRHRLTMDGHAKSVRDAQSAKDPRSLTLVYATSQLMAVFPESANETDAQREWRLRVRKLFGSVASRYDGARSNYPAEVVDWMVAMARLRQRARVLEVGCGTGQLTSQLAARRFNVTAIDMGAAMVELARANVPEPNVRFEATSFEDFTAPAASFELVASASAFHWVDPRVRWSKSAQLLARGGWIAVLSNGEKYDDPVGSRLLEARIARSKDGGAWARAPRHSVAEMIEASGLFEPALEKIHTDNLSIPAERVLALEQTRGAFLDYEAATQQSFTDELREIIGGATEVAATLETSVTMARRR
jgi:2-polyprenyl-3-methyl-5-hydroxy-6-metoxy-1,4-benzoquinol methylase